MKKFCFAILFIACFQLMTFGQTALEIKNVGGCDKIVMTIENLVSLVNTSQSNFGNVITKYDYAKSTDDTKKGQYTDGKSMSCFHSVIERLDENLDQVLTYMTDLQEIVSPLKTQLQTMKRYYVGNEGVFMKYTFSSDGSNYVLLVGLRDNSNFIKLTKKY